VEIVEIDSSGRIYIPAEIRRRIKAKRFKLRLVEDGILLEPIDDIDIYYGRFGPANSTWRKSKGRWKTRRRLIYVDVNVLILYRAPPIRRRLPRAVEEIPGEAGFSTS
jgi:AbrB family looped-hinge helix DNA binding protein